MHILEHFERICAIPRKDQQNLIRYLIAYAQEHNLPFEQDSYGNLAIGRGDILLQGHVDMVCEGDHDWNKPITLVKGEEWWSAKGTSLGADDGIGVAAMLAALDAGWPVRCIFTLDEETGCIGAAHCDLIYGKYLINLDMESPTICIGCAGSARIEIEIPYASNATGERVEVTGLPGGHSGGDIDKGIPNAIIELYKKVKGKQVTFIEGGNASNAIPRDAYAIIGEKGVDLSIVDHIPVGVIKKDTVVRTSNNLGIIKTLADKIVLTYMVRSCYEKDIDAMIAKIGGKVISRMRPWEPEESILLSVAKNAFKEQGLDPQVEVIHAALECASFSLPRISIGPTIEHAHSPSERLNVKSVHSFWKILETIVRKLS